MNEKMSSVKALLSETKSKKEFRQQQKQEKIRATHTKYAQKNKEAIQKLIKERCPLDHQQILAIVDGFFEQATTLNGTKLELPPLHPGILSTLLYNMALWVGNMQQASE